MFDQYSKKKKIAIIVAIVVLVLIVIIAIIVATRPKKTHAKKSKKLVEGICQHMDACENALSQVAGKTSDPRELIKLAFHEAIKDMDVAIKNTSILQKAAGNDPKTIEALKACNNLLNNSNGDLKKCADKLDTVEFGKLITFYKDFKRWIGGAVKNQQACLNGFKNIAGDTGEKMQEMLKTPMELTNNGQTMIKGLATVLPSLDNLGLGRRLLFVQHEIL
ncbi:probable pectinesterase/pectinesterase inhibitor 58 [Cornus florida]|uniref:probable pectinesterase/pectinesterase inhibitor 58 n=1 Tax=Cornus florida TaxID=4283 RepID=UPI00289EA46E|nr:probable pectinesterase/pectinesterase inhibitor 58 [Cornus florida]